MQFSPVTNNSYVSQATNGDLMYTQNAVATSVQPQTYNSFYNNNNTTSNKRKVENDDYGRSTAKRIHISSQEQENVNQIEQIMPAITYASPDYKPYRLSSNATANMANSIIPLSTPPTEQGDIDIMMDEDDSTDEDDTLQTPMTCSTSFITHYIGEDLDQGGYTGSLERGWSEMFNEM